MKIKPLHQYQSYGIQGDTDRIVGEIQGEYGVKKIKPLFQYQSYGTQGETDRTVGGIQGDQNQTLA
jgi:hypothetical protein